MKYSYYAKILREVDGVTIDFPDLPGCISCAFNESDVIPMAQEALALYLEDIDFKCLPEAKNYLSDETAEYILIELEL